MVEKNQKLINRKNLQTFIGTSKKKTYNYKNTIEEKIS